MTQEEFGEGMLPLMEIYNKTLTKVSMDVYYKFLQPLTKEEFDVAVEKILKSSKTFPKPVELINVTRLRVYTKAELWE